MRLDKFFTAVGLLSRKEAAGATRAGRITVNGETVRRADGHIDEQSDLITLDGVPVGYSEFDYFWLNKPSGYVSATEDGRFPCVTELLPPPYDKRGLFPCGRLDRDTVGLMLLTNDGELSHRLLSPRHHVEKEYRFICDAPLALDAEARFAEGMMLGSEPCKPAVLLCDPDRTGGVITLTEGKYHQIKRMVEACGATVISLERISFAGIALDPSLARGELRPLTDEEIERLRHAAD
ncbi:MAG: rRNA pseudouridine synthase [Clostridia bacterium]|nr:rRNA pseudouridine synthase [Clostridia bacterium]